MAHEVAADKARTQESYGEIVPGDPAEATAIFVISTCVDVVTKSGPVKWHANTAENSGDDLNDLKRANFQQWIGDFYLFWDKMVAVGGREETNLPDEADSDIEQHCVSDSKFLYDLWGEEASYGSGDVESRKRVEANISQPNIFHNFGGTIVYGKMRREYNHDDWGEIVDMIEVLLTPNWHFFSHFECLMTN